MGTFRHRYGELPSQFKRTGSADHPFVFRSYRLSVACTKLAWTGRILALDSMIWHVSSTSSDAHDGRSSGTAFKTLAEAVAVAKPGDTILIAPGAYDQNLPIHVSAARSANIVVAVAGGE